MVAQLVAAVASQSVRRPESEARMVAQQVAAREVRVVAQLVAAVASQWVRRPESEARMVAQQVAAREVRLVAQQVAVMACRRWSKSFPRIVGPSDARGWQSSML